MWLLQPTKPPKQILNLPIAILRDPEAVSWVRRKLNSVNESLQEWRSHPFHASNFILTLLTVPGSPRMTNCKQDVYTVLFGLYIMSPAGQSDSWVLLWFRFTIIFKTRNIKKITIWDFPHATNNLNGRVCVEIQHFVEGCLFNGL